MILQWFSTPCVAQNNKLLKLHYNLNYNMQFKSALKSYRNKTVEEKNNLRNLGTNCHFWQPQCISALTLVTFYSSACFTSQVIYM